MPTGLDASDLAELKAQQEQGRFVAVIVHFRHADPQSLNAWPDFEAVDAQALVDSPLGPDHRVVDFLNQRDDWFQARFLLAPGDPRLKDMLAGRRLLVFNVDPSATNITITIRHREDLPAVPIGADGPVIKPALPAGVSLVALHNLGEVEPKVVRWGLVLRLQNHHANSAMTDDELTLASGCMAERHTRIQVTRSMEVLPAATTRNILPEQYVMDFFDISQGQRPRQLNFWPVPRVSKPLREATRSALLAAAKAAHGNVRSVRSYGPNWYATTAAQVKCVSPMKR
jgi:hypothetical protein